MTTVPRRPETAAATDPQSVGDYDLVSLLGQGGMGTVYLAHNRRTDRRVALKLLRTQFVSDEEGRRRLEREVRSQERVRSPLVAEIVDADPWGPVPYVATRYVPGPSLHDKVAQEGPLKGADLDHFAERLAEGIAACHAVGVLHRDIKPSNVLIEGRTPILIDFGLARVADDPKITVTGLLLGTPGYLPPEILHGDEATPATDVHSWAATVAYAASGRPPYGSGPSMAVMDRARRGEHDLDGIAQPLRDVLDRALAPDPAKRPTLDELRAWLRDPSRPLGAAATPPPPDPEDEKDTQRLAGEPEQTVVRPRPEGPIPPPVEPPIKLAPTPPGPPTAGERMRRRLLWLTLLVFTAGWFAVLPGPGPLLVLGALWLLRAGTYAAGDLQRWRWYRGAKWYDAPRLLVGAPWRLLRAVPKTFFLGIWAAGFVLAVMLVSWAVQAKVETALFCSGLAFVLALWIGSGRERLRDPLATVVYPLSSSWGRWAVAFCVAVILAAVPVQILTGHGPMWGPDGEPHFMRVLFG